MDSLDYKILRWIYKRQSPVPDSDLIARFGKPVSEDAIDVLIGEEVIDRLVTENDYKSMGPLQIDPYPTGDLYVTDKGEAVLARYKYQKSLTKREKWIERFIGFVSGVLTTITATISLYLLGILN